MSKLKQEPPQGVRSLDELFAIAYAMEEEAAARYTELATRLRSDENPELAEVFQRLAEDEKGHLDSVVTWSLKEKGAAPDLAQILWQPETFDDEGISVSDPRLVSAYRALAMAVRNEERAFAFWTYVSANAGKREIAEAAEALAREELEHVAALRRERRKAYRAARTVSKPSLEDGIVLERNLSEKLAELVGSATESKALVLRKFADEAIENAEILAGMLPGRLSRAQAVPAITDPVAISEFLVDLYLEAAESVEGEAAIADAQVLAGRAINRLAWLRADLPEIELKGAGHE
jgi:rubrerythrin